MRKVVLEYLGALSAISGITLLLFSFVRRKDIRDFLWSFLLHGKISQDWDAAVFLVLGGCLTAFAVYSGVLGPHRDGRES